MRQSQLSGITSGSPQKKTPGGTGNPKSDKLLKVYDEQITKLSTENN